MHLHKDSPHRVAMLNDKLVQRNVDGRAEEDREAEE